MTGLVLSLFPGVGLLDRGFESVGYCVVRGPDTLWGGDVRAFTPTPGHFEGVIGGPPCQDFSSARRVPPTGNGLKMLAEFRRVVETSRPAWWLMENVDGVPDVRIDGYSWQRIDVELGWWTNVRRLRHVQFGARDGAYIDIEAGRVGSDAAAAVLASDDRSFAELCAMQGLPAGFDLPGFTVEAKKRAVGNGVPFDMAQRLARAVRVRSSGGKRCGCPCRRLVTEEQTYAGVACRKRAQRRRDRTKGPVGLIAQA